MESGGRKAKKEGMPATGLRLAVVLAAAAGPRLAEACVGNLPNGVFEPPAEVRRCHCCQPRLAMQ